METEGANCEIPTCHPRKNIEMEGAVSRLHRDGRCRRAGRNFPKPLNFLFFPRYTIRLFFYPLISLFIPRSGITYPPVASAPFAPRLRRGLKMSEPKRLALHLLVSAEPPHIHNQLQDTWKDMRRGLPRKARRKFCAQTTKPNLCLKQCASTLCGVAYCLYSKVHGKGIARIMRLRRISRVLSHQRTGTYTRPQLFPQTGRVDIIQNIYVIWSALFTRLMRLSILVPAFASMSAKPMTSTGGRPNT